MLASTGREFDLTKYVDLNSFSHLLRVPPQIAVAVGVSLAVVAVVALLYVWRFGPRELAWAAAIVAPLLLNVDAGIWESTLLIVALALMSPFVKLDRAPLIIVVCAAPLLAPLTTARLGVQVLTLVIFGVLVYQARLVAGLKAAGEATRPGTGARLPPAGTEAARGTGAAAPVSKGA
jgi:hypothetical protein